MIYGFESSWAAAYFYLLVFFGFFDFEAFLSIFSLIYLAFSNRIIFDLLIYFNWCHFKCRVPDSPSIFIDQ